MAFAELCEPILQAGDQRLQRVAEEVECFNTEMLNYIAINLLKAMKVARGAGIAAPQLGFNKRIIVFGGKTPRYPQSLDIPRQVLVNPSFKPLGHETDQMWEGCLSVPNVRGLIPRFTHITYQGYTLTGERVDGEVSGFIARIIQHEIDHLDGILFPQRMVDVTHHKLLSPEVIDNI